MGLHRSGDEMPFTIIHKEQLPEIYGLRELGLSYKQISKLYGVDKTAISAAIYSKRYLKYYTEKQFREKVNKFLSKNQNKYEKRFLLNGYHTKRVIQYDKKGTIVNTFDSITDAAKANNVLKTSICNNLKGLSKFCGGYKYEYKQD